MMLWLLAKTRLQDKFQLYQINRFKFDTSFKFLSKTRFIDGKLVAIDLKRLLAFS